LHSAYIREATASVQQLTSRQLHLSGAVVAVSVSQVAVVKATAQTRNLFIYLLIRQMAARHTVIQTVTYSIQLYRN